MVLFNTSEPLLTRVQVQIQCTLAQVYSNLPSPNLQLTGPSTETIPKLLDFSFDIEETLGLRSRLYQYQRQTVAQLIQRECGKASIPDPLYVPIKSVTGTTFFFQPGTYEVLQERPMVVPTTGGILCEELGRWIYILFANQRFINQIKEPGKRS